MRKVQKSLSLLCLSTLMLGISYSSSYADDVTDVRMRVLDLQNSDVSLPSGVAEQKGKVGTILGTLFDTSTSGEATIKNVFLATVFGSLSGNRLVKYDSSTGRFIDSTILETPDGIGVGGGVLNGYIANFTGNVNITGNITAAIPISNDHVATKEYVDESAGVWNNDRGDGKISYDEAGSTPFVGIGIANPLTELHVAGNIRVTDSPVDEQDVGNKTYNDSRYIVIGSSGDQIEDSTIDSTEIENNSLTASDLATNSVGNTELIDAPTVSTLNITAGTGNGVRFWGGDSYKIHMGAGSEYAYGPVTGYSIKNNMNSNSTRGWTWGVTGAVPTVAFNTEGNAQFAGTVTAATPTLATHLTTKEYVDAHQGLWSSAGTDIIEYSGDVGIGDSTPDGDLKLDISGKIGADEYCDSDGNNCKDILNLSPFWETDDVDGKLQVTGTNQDIRLYSYSTSPAGNKSDVEVMRARGTTASPLKVESGDELGGYRFRGYDGNQFITPAGIYTKVTGATSVGNIPVRMSFVVDNQNTYSTDTPERMVITSDGDVGIGVVDPSYMLEVNGSAGKTGGGSWTNSSDARLKDINGDYEYGLDAIKALNPIRFSYKQGNARDLESGTNEVGFIAQEVQKVIPDAVSEGEDGYLDFNMHSINVALVNAVKELFVVFQKDAEETDIEIEALTKIVKIQQEQIKALQESIKK